MKRVWVVLSDPFPTRVFVDCGIVSGLEERLPRGVEAILVLPREEVDVWAGRLGDVPWTNGAELFPAERRDGRAQRAPGRLRARPERGVLPALRSA